MVSFVVHSRNAALVAFGTVFFTAVFFEVNSRLLDPILISQELRSFANDALGVDELQVR